jgi:hypothetical protein
MGFSIWDYIPIFIKIKEEGNKFKLSCTLPLTADISQG